MNTIAVIIPCYNGWKYMENCLRALECQTIKPEQIIIVDDCSKDDSYSKLVQYQEQTNLNVLVLKNEINSGPSISRRNAVERAVTDYVAFCDCDDWYETDFIEKAKEYIDKTEADILLFDNYNVYNGQKEPANTVKKLVGKSKNELVAVCGMSLCKKVIKKICFETVEFPPLYHSEDGVVLLQIIDKVEKIICCDEPLYNYYFRDDSASKQLSKRAYDDSKEAFRIIEQKFKNKYPEECEFLGIKYFLYCAVVNGIKSERSYNEIKADILTFFKKYPRWYKNKYIDDLNKGKRLYLCILRFRMFLLFPLMSKMHTVIVKARIKKKNN